MLGGLRGLIESGEVGVVGEDELGEPVVVGVEGVRNGVGRWRGDVGSQRHQGAGIHGGCRRSGPAGSGRGRLGEPDEPGRVERSTVGVADLEVEVGTRRDAVAARAPAAGAQGDSARDAEAGAEVGVDGGEVGVARADGLALARRADPARVVDLDDEPVARPPPDRVDGARRSGRTST